MVQLMRAGEVQVLALQVDLGQAELPGKAFAVIDWGRAALVFPADPAEFRNELRGVGDGLIGFGDLLESRDQFVWDKAAAIRSVITVFVRRCDYMKRFRIMTPPFCYMEIRFTLSRFSIREIYSSFLSQRIARKPFFVADAPVVPEPAIGSNTI